MKIGFIFPGQGTQTVGMGKDLYEQYEEVRNVYKRVDNAIGESVEDITYHISQEELNETKNTQIAIFTMSMAILEILKQKGIKAVASAGLSLGEYSALGYGNVFSLEEGARIVRKRGEFMQSLVPEGNWAMAAVIGMKDEEVEKVCDAVYQKGGFVKAVNYNCPGQVAISGRRSNGTCKSRRSKKGNSIENKWTISHRKTSKSIRRIKERTKEYNFTISRYNSYEKFRWKELSKRRRYTRNSYKTYYKFSKIYKVH